MRMLGWLVVSFCILASSACFAWDAKGHQTIGEIADVELNDHARTMVQSLIGMSLGMAGPWLDCVKDVKGSPGHLRYIEDESYAAGCKVFWTAQEEAAIVTFAGKNWDNCPSSSPGNPCHGQYHFTDIDVSAVKPLYQLGEPGTNDYDVVQAINAAVATLRGQPPGAPFPSDLSKREALLMIAHLVGDLHQPLHVGAIYLAADGKDQKATTGDDDDPGFTRGGNFIFVGSAKLHSLWDRVSTTTAANAKGVASSLPENATGGGPHTWAQAWADEVVLVSKSELEDLRYQAASAGGKHWPVDTTSCDVTCYAEDIAAVQEKQVATAGRHMADLLNSVWP